MSLSNIPVLRADLEITARIADGSTFLYYLNDQKNEEIYEFSEREYFLLQQLKEQYSLDHIVNDFERNFDVPLKRDDLQAFIRQLKHLGLLVCEADPAEAQFQTEIQNKSLHLGNPDRFLSWLSESLSFYFSKFFLMAILLSFGIAIGIAIKYGGNFVYEMKLIWKPGFFILLPILGLFILNPLFEIAKGIAFKHYGESVYEFGVYFLYKFIPHFYCDMSSILWIEDKSTRIKIFSAGLVSQTLFWTISVIGWENSIPWTGIHIFWLLCSVASTIFLLLNIIPFFQRDGYYLLSILLNIPDLRERAVALVKSKIFRKPLPEPLSSREMKILQRFGVMCIIFDLVFWGLFMGLIGYFMCIQFKGLGALVFLLVFYFRFGDYMKRFYRGSFLQNKLVANQSGGIIFRRLFQLGLLIFFIILLFFPYSFTVGGEFQLLPARQLGIRAQVDAEISEVVVTENQWIAKDETVAILVDRDQKRRAEGVKAALEESEAKLRLLKEGPKPEEIAKAKQEAKTADRSLKYSTMMADRQAILVKQNATSVQSYENALKQRDLDIEKLELAKRNLELVESGARDEEIEALEAEVRRLKVELRHAQEDLELTTLTSPIEGRIITPHLKQKAGQRLKEGDLFAVVEDAQVIIAEIEVFEEDVGEIKLGSRVILKTWVYPNTRFKGKVVAVAPVAYEKSRGRVERTLTEQELIFEENEILREKGKVVRILTELDNSEGLLKTGMTGYAKIECEKKPVAVAFTRWLVRFIMVEVWSWIP